MLCYLVLVIFSYVFTGMGWDGWLGCDAFCEIFGRDERERMKGEGRVRRIQKEEWERRWCTEGAGRSDGGSGG